MRKKQKLNLFLTIPFIVSLAFISINTSHLSIFLLRDQTFEDLTISVLDTPKLSWEIGWKNDGEPICTEASTQYILQICSDGNGGGIITWGDYRSGSTFDIYAQRINANGVIQWTVDGVAICTASDSQLFPQICSDGNGGAIITWKDYRSSSISDIYAQRINANGVVQWIVDGVAICTASDTQSGPQICSDGDGGAIIAWQDDRGTGYDIYAQRVNANGVVQWTVNGVTICIATNNQVGPQICSDGGGGAIIAWKDFRGGSSYDIYTQRVNTIGVVQWTVNGVTICTANKNQNDPQICSDGGGGAIIAWEDLRGGSSFDIYAQRVNSNGIVQWTVNGSTICTVSDSQSNPQICSDGGGGAIIAWQDFRGGSSYDIYAQRVNTIGVVQWTINGSTICTTSGSQDFPQICSDGGGGAIIAWKDYRSGSNYDIYAQKIKNIVPTSNHPADINTSTDGLETINWTLYDDSGGGQYRVLVNSTMGALYIWMDWTSWINNTPFSISINRTIPGIYDYIIEYYDDQNAYGVLDTVVITIKGTSISFGYYFLPFSFISIIFIIINWKRKIKHN